MYLRYVKIIPRLTNLKKMSGINLWNQLIKQANFYGGLSHKEPYHMWQWMLMRDSADTSYTVLELFSNEKCFMIINSASSAQIIFFSAENAEARRKSYSMTQLNTEKVRGSNQANDSSNLYWTCFVFISVHFEICQWCRLIIF